MKTRREESSIVLIALLFVAIIYSMGWFQGYHTAKGEFIREQKEEIAAVEPVDTLDDWTILQMAIMLTESEYNPKAVGKAKDYGILQITPVYVKECNRILNEERYVHEDAFDIDKSLEMFYIIQHHYNPDEDLDTAIRCHNRAGWYAQRVKSNIVKVKRMEEARRKVIEKRQEI